MTVMASGENTRLVVPGDHVQVTGVLLPLIRNVGFKSMTQGLATETFLEVHVSLISQPCLHLNYGKLLLHLWCTHLTLSMLCSVHILCVQWLLKLFVLHGNRRFSFNITVLIVC